MRRVASPSFRATLFWTLLGTIVAMTVVERALRATVDAVADRTEARIERRLDDAALDLESLLAEAESAAAGVATSDGRRDDREPHAVFAPVPGGTELVGPVPDEARGPGWASRTVRLRDGAIVSMEIPLEWWERAAQDRARLEGLVVVPLAVIALVTTSWLTRRLTRPLRELTLATEAMVDEQFAHPVPPPAGDDELARLARTFERTRAAIRTRIERERIFTRYVSHELRTPLSALMLQIERASLPDVDAADVIPRLQRNARRMEEVLGALMELANASTSSGGRLHDRLPLREVVTSALAALPSDEMRSRIEVADASPSGTTVRAGRLLRQALVNLLVNAARHAENRAALRIWVDGDQLEIRVVDDGAGVPDEDLARLTQPFYRSGTRTGSLGLGLALVATIADELHGELILRNRHPGFEAALRLPGVVGSVS